MIAMLFPLLDSSLCMFFYPTLLGNLPVQAPEPRALSAGRQQPAGGAATDKKPCRSSIKLLSGLETK